MLLAEAFQFCELCKFCRKFSRHVARRSVPDKQRNACLRFVVEQNVNRIQAGLGKFQLLDVDDEIVRGEKSVVGQFHEHRHVNLLHDRLAVGVDEFERDFALALVAGHEGHAQRDRALRVRRGKFLCKNRVERAEQIQFAVVVRRRVANHRHLNVHAEIKPRIS